MKTYPISEVFCAPQGEGMHAGRLMIFLRFAGCTVGKRFSPELYERSLDKIDIFPIYTNKCTTYDGREFPCDTDYRKKMELNIDGILALLKETHPTCKHVCITGGEPLMHDLSELRTLCESPHRYRLFLETSGTIELPADQMMSLFDIFAHVAVSPKKGFLPVYAHYAAEFKLLVDENFAWEKVPFDILSHPSKIFLQPINGEHTVNEDNMKRCLDIQLAHPEVRISTQTHKLWHTR